MNLEAAERDALKAEVERLGTACDNYFRQVSLMQMRHARHLPLLETRIARQRRALAKLYRKRHDRKAENARLRGAIEMAIDCIQDKADISARLTLTLALGETQ